MIRTLTGTLDKSQLLRLCCQVPSSQSPRPGPYAVGRLLGAVKSTNELGNTALLLRTCFCLIGFLLFYYKFVFLLDLTFSALSFGGQDGQSTEDERRERFHWKSFSNSD